MGCIRIFQTSENKQRKQLGTGKANYGLPPMKIENSYHTPNQKSLQYIKANKPKKSMSKREGQVSHSFDRRSRKSSNSNIPTVKGMKRKNHEDKKINIQLNYKPPLPGNNRGFAAQMMKNRNKYFSKNIPDNTRKYKSKGREIENTPKYGTSSTAEIRKSQM